MTLNSPMSMRQINYANRLIYYDLKLLTVYQHQIQLSIATGLPTKNETSETNCAKRFLFVYFHSLFPPTVNLDFVLSQIYK